MSKTMGEVFDQVARECGWECWLTAYNEDGITNIAIAEAASRYAELYAQFKTQELVEQNRELVELVKGCKDVICAYNNWSPTPTGKEIIEDINERITKYNHLKQ